LSNTHLFFVSGNILQHHHYDGRREFFLVGDFDTAIVTFTSAVKSQNAFVFNSAKLNREFSGF